MSNLLDAPEDPVTQDYDRLRFECGWFDLRDFALIELTGDDRKGWLQGQVTQDLRRFDAGTSTAFCLCEPSGQLLTIAQAWALTDRIFLTIPKPTLPAVLNRTRQMVVLEDVVARDVTSEFRILSLQGPTATRKLADKLNLPNLDAGQDRVGDIEVYCLRSDRNGLGGWDILVPAKSRKAINAIGKLGELISPEVQAIGRLEAGIPTWGSDATAKTLPPELGSAFSARHISYTKGCYTGQEVLMRLHSRGHTNRTWMGLTSEHDLPVGSPIRHPSRADAGTVVSSAFSPDFGFIGAAMLRNEAANPRDRVYVQTSEGWVEAEVRPMPLLRLD